MKFAGNSAVIGVGAAIVGISLAAASPAHASLVTLQDGNSLVQLNPTSNGDPSQDGVYTWNVNGVNQLGQQWFWYRLGNSGPASDLTTLNEVGSPTLLSTDGGPGDNYASINYSGSGFTLNLQYLLVGGAAGSNSSDLQAIVSIDNTSSKTLDFDLVNYDNFSPANNSSMRTVTIANGNTANETILSGDLAQVLVSPSSTQYDAATSGFVTGLDSGSLVPLPDNSSTSGSDPAFAFGFDLSIPAHDSSVISADEVVTAPVPEPMSAATLLAPLLFLRRRRSVS
ncbi:MAG TPA: hypothetical protein VMD30_12140 [Tepidisphaeraceae bacterium]|nr:hypothetical protein [Tepidisphaeraceae bacterium]